MKPNYLKFFLYLAIAFVVAGCGGGSNSNKTISVSISGAPTTIAPSAMATLSAVVTNDAANAGVTWGVTGAGTFTSTTTQLIYTAPATVPDTPTVTVTATSVTDPTKMATVTFTIATPTISVTITNPISTIAPGAAAVTVNATVANDGATPGVAWSLVNTGTTTDCQPACGTITVPTTTSVLYTPPATVPSPATATLIATSNSDTTKTATDNFTITATSNATCTTPGTLGNEAALSLPYAFILKGQDANGNQPLDYVGSFTPNGSGSLSAADMDINGFSTGSIPTSIDLESSSYSYGADGRGCLFMVFTEVSSNAKKIKASKLHVHAKHSRSFTAQRKPHRAVSGEEIVTFAFALVNPTGAGRIQEFDNTTGDGFFAAGQMHAQTSSAFSVASLSENFAFGIDGWINEEGLVRSAIAGSFANDTGVFSNLTADEDFGGDISGEQTGGEGSLDATVSSTTGRGTGTLSINTGEGPLQFDFVYYVINGSDVLIMASDDTDDSSVLFAGRALSTGTTNTASNGFFMFALTGLDCTSCNTTDGNNVVQIATLSTTTAGAAAATVYANDGGNFMTNTYTGTYTIEAATQRGQVTLTGDGAPPIAYFTNTAEEDDIIAFLVGTDEFGSGGFVTTQSGSSAPNFDTGSLNDNYAEGTAEDLSGLNGSETGVWNFNGTGGYSNTLDLVQSGGTSTTPFMFTGNYTMNADGSGAGTYTSTGGTTVAFVTSGSIIFSTEESSVQPQLHVFIAEEEAEKAAAKPVKTTIKHEK